MHPITLTPELLATAPGIATRMAALVAGLIAVIARVFLKHPRHAGIILPLCNWLTRSARRFTRVMQQLEAGQLRPRTPRPGQPSSGKRPIAIPRQRAWLLADLKHEGAFYANRINELLSQPETAALIAATPQAQRLLRPICHILGVMPAALKPARPPRATGTNRGTPGRQPSIPARTAPNPERPARQPGDPIGALASWRSSTATHPVRSQAAPNPPPDPFANLCPRLRTRWPFSQLPQIRES